MKTGIQGLEDRTLRGHDQIHPYQEIRIALEQDFIVSTPDRHLKKETPECLVVLCK
jgi:hypothetical protein